jgi:negative regulator of flagellin synthesis FlgM
MRIDLSNTTASQLSSELNAKPVTAQNATQSGGVNGEDHATLTSDSTSVGSLVSTALSSPEVRQGKVDSLRQAISSGQYAIDPPSIAASMVGKSA